MPINPWYTVWCEGPDECPNWQDHGGHTRKEAWDNAKRAGWKRVKGVILCPACQKLPPEPRP